MRLGSILTLVLLAGCLSEQQSAYDWQLPDGFPKPLVPDTSMSLEKVSLGRKLFFDVRLSSNGSQACASCHIPARAFTDGLAHAKGSTGDLHPRGSMSLANLVYATSFTWLDDGITSLEAQALRPLFGTETVELGWLSREALEQHLQQTPDYPSLFRSAFPRDAMISTDNVARALASYERTLLSGASPFDKYRSGDSAAISASAKNGYALFFGDRLKCSRCHGGFTLANAEQDGRVRDRTLFADNGLGLFKVPSLRNIAVTAPYMHDGSIESLDEALSFYARGGVPDGSARSEGRSALLTGFELSAAERADIVEFLHSLTDESFIGACEHELCADDVL